MTRYASRAVESTHAHPSSPMTPPEFDDQEMQWGSLYTNGLQLRGLPGEDRSTVYEIYCPDVRRSEYDSKSLINHLDLISSWKGLSLQQAEEILTWERVFRRVLEGYISESVRMMISTLPAIKDDTFTCTHYVDIALEDLVHKMLDFYYAGKPDQRPARPWALLDRDLPSFAYNFLRTRDCFINSARPCVQVDLVFSLAKSSIQGEIIWQPSDITIEDLPITLSPGSLYAIQPDYRTPDFGNSPGTGFSVFPERVEFMVSSQGPTLECVALGEMLLFTACLELSWSRSERSFCGIVPQSNEPVIETNLIAQSTMQFPAGVRFVRTSRYNIKLLSLAHAQLAQGHDASFRPLQRVDSVSPERPCFISQNVAMSLDGTDEGRSESATEPTAARSDRRLNEEWRKTHVARVDAGMKDSNTITEHVGARTDLPRMGRPSKRKAEGQTSMSSTTDVTPSEPSPLTGDFSDCSPELAMKRQRLQGFQAADSVHSSYTVSATDEIVAVAAESWTDKHLDDLGRLSTTCVGEAHAGYASKNSSLSKASRTLQWKCSSKSRAYTTTGASRVMPGLRRKGSVKRMFFSRSAWTRGADSPVNDTARSASQEGGLAAAWLEHVESLPRLSSHPDQATIRRNYDEFLELSGHFRFNSDEAREAQEYESFFLNSPSGADSVSDGLSAMSLDAD